MQTIQIAQYYFSSMSSDIGLKKGNLRADFIMNIFTFVTSKVILFAFIMERLEGQGSFMVLGLVN